MINLLTMMNMNILTLILLFIISQSDILFANWDLSITGQDAVNSGASHTITLGTCDECIDGWSYSEDQYDYVNPNYEYTNIHFFHPDWNGVVDTTGYGNCNCLFGNDCPFGDVGGCSFDFSTDFRSVHPASELITWDIRGYTGNDLSPNIPIKLSWDSNEVENLSSEYELYIQVGSISYDMRLLSHIYVSQDALGTTNGIPNISITMGACAASGTTTHYFDSDNDNWGGNSSSEFCEGYAPDGWVINNSDEDDNFFCESNLIDCMGELCGDTLIDECGICGGNGIPDGNCDCSGNILDCKGTCGGNAELDLCNICDGNNLTCQLGCESIGNYWGCDNICNGGIIDECGECNGSGPIDGYTCNGLPLSFNYHNSSKQAFYYFENVTIDDKNLDANDWIGSFIGNTCIGARKWDTTLCGNGICDVPVMGDDGTSQTSGYITNGQTPTFKVFDASENSYYNATPSEEISWSDMDLNFINSLTAIATLNYCIELHPGANLISFYALPTDLLIANIVSNIEQQVNGIITEAGACQQISPGLWVGSECTIQHRKGYWFILNYNSRDNFQTYDLCLNDALIFDSGMVYNLSSGANLISFPSNQTMVVNEALPIDTEPKIKSVISEGAACTQLNEGFWIGVGCNLTGGKGYWFIANEDVSFSFNINELNRSETKNRIKYPQGYELAQSSEQAFYFVDELNINNKTIENGWILAYHENIIIGARQWDGEIIDIPVMGDDSYKYSQGYINTNEIPQFKHLNEHNGVLTDLKSNNIPKWENNGIYIIGELFNNDILPNQISLGAYPNPFNPITNIKFSLPENSMIELSIYNISGREIEKLYFGHKVKGNYEFSWNASNYSSGIYFARLQTSMSQYTQKIILMK